MARAPKSPKCELCEAENDGVKMRSQHKMNLCAECNKEQTAEASPATSPAVPDPTPAALTQNLSKEELGRLIIEQVDLLERRKILAIGPLYRLVRQWRLAK